MELTSFEEEAVWYAPDFHDNRELEAEDRFEVLIQPLPRRDLQRLQEAHQGSLHKGKRTNVMRRYHKMRDQAIAKCVLDVRNLSWRRVVKGEVRTETIDSADALLASTAPAVDEIIEDIMSALKDQSVLEDGVRGKSDSPSDISG